MKIFCIGRNYKAHAAEMMQEAPTTPIIFMKPETALVDKSKLLPMPTFTKDFQHELEIVLFINKEGKNIAVENANDYFNEWTVGIDFVARDIQTELKKKGLPWEISKSFDGAALVGDFVTISDKNLPADFYLNQNGNTVQHGHTENMIFPFAEIIAYISRYFKVEIGDLIFTGTPAGVGPIQHGDRLSGFLNGSCLFDVQMESK